MLLFVDTRRQIKNASLHLLEVRLGMALSFGGSVPQGFTEQLFLLTFVPLANEPLFLGSSAAQGLRLLSIR